MDVLRKILKGYQEKGSQPGVTEEVVPIRLELSHLEVPSNRVAFALAMAVYRQRVELDVVVHEIPVPDPRYARAHVDYRLWHYDGIDPLPAVDPPEMRVADAVAELARRDFHADVWFAEAAPIVQSLGSDCLPGLLGAMVHPPLLPPEFSAWVWLQRVQVAAAMMIARLDTGWEGSIRRKALCSLVLGPVDWSVEAAILALLQIARETPEARPEIDHLFARLIRERPKGGICYEYALVRSILRLPGLPDDARKLYEDIKTFLEQPQELDAETEKKMHEVEKRLKKQRKS